MDFFFKCTAVLLLVLMSFVLVRVIKGPTVIDRIVGVNIIGTKAAVLLVIMGVLFKRVEMFVDIAIAYALLNFIASIAAGRFFQHHKTLRPKSQWKGEVDHS